MSHAGNPAPGLSVSGQLPYWRLASFYFFHYATLGALVPYWSLYMEARGYSAVEIGEVMAVILAGRLVAPTVWAWLADRRETPRLTMVLSAMLALVAFALVDMAPGFASLALVMGAFSVGLSGVIPQFEANTFNHLGEQPERYGRIRVWGSLGFIFAVTTAGFFLQRWQVTSLPGVVSAFLACMLVATLITPVSRARAHGSRQGSLREVLGQTHVLALLSVCFLVQASFGPYYVFFSVYLDDLGYAERAIGALWALGVASEIAVFAFASQLFRRFSLSRLFQVSVGLCVLRWLATADLAAEPMVLVLVQLTHMATFGLYHAVAVSLINRFFTGPLQVRGQGLYSSLSFGAGGIAGSIGSGYAWQHFGPRMTYYLAALVAAAALLITLAALRRIPGYRTGDSIDE